MLKVYEYSNCGTCKKAFRFLDARGVAYTKVPIRETPPSKTELRTMLGHMNGEIRKLFNVSGQDYRAGNFKEKLPKLSEDQAIELLSQNGNLVKRPFALSNDRGTVGFDEAEWKKLF